MKIAILTTFMEFNPGYSLTGIVKDQITMLLKYGHEVHLYVNEQYNDKTPIIEYTPETEFHLHKEIPFAHLKDYSAKHQLIKEHRPVVEKMSVLVRFGLDDYDVIITHDLVFTGWNMIYALGIIEGTKDAPKPSWLHWIHSIPSANYDWWNIRAYGPRHKLVYPNKTDQRKCAEQYQGFDDHVVVIPHIKDLRTWFDFCPETCKFIEDFPKVMRAKIVQILPASADRLASKRVKEVIQIFGNLKKRAGSVCLVVANQWATGKNAREKTEQYFEIARQCNLEPMEEVIFTSEWESPTYETGIPKRMVRELFQCSNLFIFPTREESFGLAVPEASLSGGCLMVLNRSLPQQIEISNNEAVYFDFGSHEMPNYKPECGWDKYLNDLATIIFRKMTLNESITTRTFMRRKYNMDYLYYAHYEPIMSESKGWR